MPGPGAHMMYAMGCGLGMTSMSNGRFSPHHTVVYTVNAFFGPDIGCFSEWVGSLFGGSADAFGSSLSHLIHDPFLYVLLLGIPLSFLYSRLSSYLLQTHLLDSLSRLPLTRIQCFFLISAGSFTHFFLDHLFEENGKTTMYTWILSTGWWQSRAPVNPVAVVVVGFLCVCLIGGFVYLNRASASISIKNKSYQSMLLIISIAILYCFWCAIQIYWVSPRRPAVGEEADLGVLVFLAIYFFLPYSLCIMSMSPKSPDPNQIPV
ncbi:hypothetical protein VNO78_23877 [Psophocarpus tetragonolobus]|uniref:Uncharacterized protein n=1 Tax=Psophocarpus tetragonolobus TaxID=3891 RepID=A0AAN9S595_PSOTE